MIDVKQAVAIAVKYVADLLGSETIHDIRLEEVELSANEEVWYVTVSFLRPPKATTEPSLTDALSQLVAGRSRQMEREYKVLAVRAQDGQVTSMKIRQLPQPV